MAKHTWTDNELITKELLNSIEDRIEAKAQRGETGPAGPAGAKGDRGEAGPAGTNGIFTEKLNAVSVTGESGAQLKATLDSLIADMKAKGLVNDA